MKAGKIFSIFIALLASLGVALAPSDFFHIAGLTIIEQRVIALFVFATILWLTEAIPVWATSIVVTVLMLLTVSDSALSFLRETGVENFGKLIHNESIITTFADPIIMLFLGGFFIAIAAEKCGLDKNLAHFLFSPFGKKSKNVLLGVMSITALFSMFMSNTATAAMMFALLYPILKSLKENSEKIAFVLSIPIAANIGGIGTPIGTPPNAIALKYLNDVNGLNLQIGFGQWMLVMVPFVCVVIFVSWLMLIKLFPFNSKTLNIKLDSKFDKSATTYIVAATFLLTVILWMLDKLTGINSNVVAMIPMAIFCATGVIKSEDLKKINWDVIWLVAGGFALGVGLNDSGLAEHLMKSIPFASMSGYLIILASGLLCYVMSTFLSNSATAALLIPILTAIAKGMGTLGSGTAPIMIVGVAISASLAMALPISTPPNAIAYSEGVVTQKQMASIGLLVGAFGFALIYTVLFTIAHFSA